MACLFDVLVKEVGRQFTLSSFVLSPVKMLIKCGFVNREEAVFKIIVANSTIMYSRLHIDSGHGITLVT